MKRLTLLFIGLLGLGMSYAEEVNIGLTETNDELLEVIPGYLFLDNNPVIIDWGSDKGNIQNNDVTVFDYNFNQSVLHFNSDYLYKRIYLVDCRNTSYASTCSSISQCFFNNDALYEGIAVDVETVINEWGYEHYSYSNFRIINQNGEVLYTFEMPEGYECGEYEEPCFYKVSDDIILVKRTYTKSDGSYESCICWYSLKTDQTSSIAPIKQMSEIKLISNPVEKGDNLVVIVGEDNGQAPIIVTSLSGKMVKEVPVIEGKAVVSTSDLSCGLYIASQKGGASAKFVVK